MMHRLYTELFVNFWGYVAPVLVLATLAALYFV
jgi:hypothetical protein